MSQEISDPRKTSNKLLRSLRQLNRSARHYFVTPPTGDTSHWVAGWIDDLNKPRMGFIVSDTCPNHLLEQIEKAILSK